MYRERVRKEEKRSIELWPTERIQCGGNGQTIEPLLFKGGADFIGSLPRTMPLAVLHFLK